MSHIPPPKSLGTEGDIHAQYQRTLVEIGFSQIEAARAVQLTSKLNRRQQKIFEIWHEDPTLARAMVAQGCLQSQMREGQLDRREIAARSVHVAAVDFSRTNRARSDSLYLFLQFKCAQCKSISAPIKYTHFVSGRSPRFVCSHHWKNLANRDHRKRFEDFHSACMVFNIDVGERVAIDSRGGHRNYLRKLTCKLCEFELADCRESRLLGGEKPKHKYPFGGKSNLCPKVEGIAKISFARTEHAVDAFPAIDSELERAARLLATNAMDKVPVKYIHCGHGGAVWKLALLKSPKSTSNGCPHCSERYRHSARAAKILAQECPTKQDFAWANKPARVVVCTTRAIAHDGSEQRFIKVGVTNGKRYSRCEILLEYSTSQIAAYTIEQNILSACPEFFGAALGMNLVDLGNAGHSETAALEAYPTIEATFKSSISQWEQGDRTPAKNSYRFRATPLGVRNSSSKQIS